MLPKVSTVPVREKAQKSLEIPGLEELIIILPIPIVMAAVKSFVSRGLSVGLRIHSL